MGREQGRCLREKIHRGLSIMTNMEAFQLQKPRWMPMQLFRRFAEFKSGRFLNQAFASALPSAGDRLRGIAAGAGVRLQELLLLNCMEAVMSDLSDSVVVPVHAGCSAVAATGQSTTTGDAILAHNFDYLPEIQPLYTVRESRPTGKLRSLEFTAAPLCGTVDGINEAGLAITYNYAYATDMAAPAPSLSMWISEALGTCRTVTETIDLLTKSDRSGGGILMLGDAEGAIASFELSRTRIALRHSSNSGDRLFHTNRYQTDRMQEVEIDSAAVHTNRSPKALRNQRVHQSSECRDDTLRRQLEGTSPLDAERILEIMSDHGPNLNPSGDTVCMHGDYWHTTACLLLYPRERRLRVAYDSTCQAQFVDFTL